MPRNPSFAPEHPRWLSVAPVLFLLLWSSGFVFLKVGLLYADPLTFLALRYACVVGILVVPCLWLKPTFPKSLDAWLHLVVIGVLLQAGYFAFSYLSVKQGLSIGAVALITSQQPILVGLLAPVIAGERVGMVHWVGLVLGGLGAGLVITAKSTVDMASVASVLFAVLALLSITAATLWEKRGGTDTHPVAANMIQYAVGFAILAPLAFMLEPMHVQWTAGLFGSLAYLVICNSIIAITLLLAMVRHGEASRVSALFFLVPPVTALIALVALDEAVPPVGWLGMLLAAGGLYLVMGRGRRL